MKNGSSDYTYIYIYIKSSWTATNRKVEEIKDRKETIIYEDEQIIRKVWKEHLEY